MPDNSKTTGPARGFLDRNGDPTTREALIAEQEADIALIAVRQITTDMMDIPRSTESHD